MTFWPDNSLTKDVGPFVTDLVHQPNQIFDKRPSLVAPVSRPA